MSGLTATDLRSMPLFEGLPVAKLEQLASQMSTREHPASQVIMLQNDWGSGVYFVQEGWVKVRTYNPDGKEVTLTILGPGEIFGEMAALDEAPRSTDVMTLTVTTVAMLSAKDFIQFLETEPLAGVHLAQLMSRRLRQINRRLQLREASSTARVADILLFLAEFRGKVSRAGIEVPNLPQRELSGLSGLARETVTRVIGKLEQDGIIKRDRSRDMLCIPNLDDLERLVAEPL